MSTYNNVLGNFLSDSNDLSDLDDYDEDSGSEPEPTMGLKYNANHLTEQIPIDQRSKLVNSLANERGDALELADDAVSVASSSNTDRERRTPIKKQVDTTTKDLILGNFVLANIVDCEEHVLCCKYSPTGDVFAVGLGNGTIKIYTKSGQFQYALADNDTKARRFPVTSIKFYANQDDLKEDHHKMLAATYTSGYVKIWHYSTQQCVFTFDEKDRQPLALDFNCNFTHLFVAGSDSAINCYDFTTKKFLHQYKASMSRELMDGHKSRVLAVRSHPSKQNVFLTGGWDETVHYWDERVDHSQKHITGPHICGDALDIVDQHRVILTGSWRKQSTLQIWDFSTGNLIKDVFGDNSTSMLYCTKYSSKNFILCAGNEKNEAIVYDYTTLQMLGGITDLENAVYCADIESIRPNIIVGSAKSILIINDKSHSR